MNLLSQIKEIRSKISGKILFDANLSKYSWFNLGGHARVIFKPKNLNELLKFRKFLKSSNSKYSVKTGNCSYDSKSMPADKKSFVISLSNFNKIIKINKLKHTVLVQSGIKISDLVKTLKEITTPF